MGAAWAPAYACLHLGCWEEEDVFCLPLYLSHVHTWLRYIDDVLVIWTGNITTLHGFIDQLNVNERNIRLTYTYDRFQLLFLDPLIRHIPQGDSGKYPFAGRQSPPSLAKRWNSHWAIHEG